MPLQKDLSNKLRTYFECPSILLSLQKPLWKFIECKKSCIASKIFFCLLTLLVCIHSIFCKKNCSTYAPISCFDTPLFSHSVSYKAQKFFLFLQKTYFKPIVKKFHSSLLFALLSSQNVFGKKWNWLANYIWYSSISPTLLDLRFCNLKFMFL